MLNIHPSLLPAFPGLETHSRALAAGVKLHGCTVHLVTQTMDEGPILAQAAVPVLPDDTAETLAEERVLVQEHILYPRALRRFASGDRGIAPSANFARRILPDDLDLTLRTDIVEAKHPICVIAPVTEGAKGRSRCSFLMFWRQKGHDVVMRGRHRSCRAGSEQTGRAPHRRSAGAGPMDEAGGDLLRARSSSTRWRTTERQHWGSTFSM